MYELQVYRGWKRHCKLGWRMQVWQIILTGTFEECIDEQIHYIVQGKKTEIRPV